MFDFKGAIFDLDGTLIDIADFRASIRKNFDYFDIDYTNFCCIFS